MQKLSSIVGVATVAGICALASGCLRLGLEDRAPAASDAAASDKGADLVVRDGTSTDVLDLARSDAIQDASSEVGDLQLLVDATISGLKTPFEGLGLQPNASPPVLLTSSTPVPTNTFSRLAPILGASVTIDGAVVPANGHQPPRKVALGRSC
jgi:hypothetical protein